MAHPVEIGIFLIAKSQINIEDTDRWLEHIGASEFEVETLTKTDADALTELAGRRCYMSFQQGLNPNVTKIRKNITEYIDNILKSNHGSVLEHSTYTFAIEGVSRVFTGEMNRHRAGWAVSEGSMRYIRFEDMGYWLPPSIQVKPDPTLPPSIQNVLINRDTKKIRTQEVIQKAFEDAEKHYAELQEIWKDELAPTSRFKDKKLITSLMRRIVPMGVATGGIRTGNIRAIRHVITMRTTEHAEEEICFVFSNILKRIAELEPNLFGDFEQDDKGFWAPRYYKV